MRVAIVTARAPDNVAGGAERLYSGLLSAFEAAGWDADEIPLYFDETNFETILDGYSSARRLNLFAYDLVISTKAPTYAVRHPNHSCWLVHTLRVFYDQFKSTFPNPSSEDIRRRDVIRQLDNIALSNPKTKLFSIGHTVSDRLKTFNGLSSSVIHPPVAINNFETGNSQGYFYIPSRLHRWKRIDLIIDAFRKLPPECCLRISGDGEEAAALASRASSSPNITFLGRVSDAELIEQYKNCLAVPFTPIEEDYGYVTIEAFLSGKPVITTRDAGEAARIVACSGGGLIADADASKFAEALLHIWRNPKEAVRLGGLGREWAESLRWGSVIRTLSSNRIPSL